MKLVGNLVQNILQSLGGNSMLKFLFRRVLAAIPVLFAILVVTFGLSQALPSGPFDAVNQRPMPEHVKAQLEQRYGLDKAVFFNSPSDNNGTDTTWGEQAYTKGGYSETTFGTYDEISNTGISFMRTYDLVRWDEATNQYIAYAENPYKNWEDKTKVISILNVSSATANLTGVTPAINTTSVLSGNLLSGAVNDEVSLQVANYQEDCKPYTNYPGWSLIATRQSCVTTGGTTSRLFNEVHKSTLIDPLDSQFWGYFWNVLHLDFGPSLNVAKINQNTQVADEINERLPVSMKLGFVSVIFGFAFGIPLGVLAAIYHNSVIDYTATFFAILGASTPNIVLAPILIIIFSVEFDLIPSPDPLVWRENKALYQFTPDLIGAMILPVIALGTGMSAGIARLTRASLLQVLHEDYIRTARAKGLRERSVIYIHALKNSLIPVATILGPLLAGILTGTFIVERIFAIPGLGESFIEGVAARDYTTIMAVTLLFSTFLIAGNILVDIIYTWLDPRIRFD